MGFIRDPRYWVPFVALIAIIAVAAVMRNSGSSEAEQVVLTPTPAATSTPDPSHTPTIDETLLDARRVFDIAAAQKALASYHNEHRSYPSTGGAFQILCSTHKDAGCVLRNYDPKLAASDGLMGYWYQSNGTTYWLFSRIEAVPESNECPATLPPALAGGPVLCATSGAGGQ